MQSHPQVRMICEQETDAGLKAEAGPKAGAGLKAEAEPKVGARLKAEAGLFAEQST